MLGAAQIFVSGEPNREPFTVNGQFLDISASDWSGIKCDGQEAQFQSLCECFH